MIKINCYVSFDYLTKVVRIDVVARDETSSLVNRGGSKILADSLKMVEALTINLGVDIVLKKACQRIIDYGFTDCI